MSTNTDTILQRAAKGDHKAQKELYLQHATRLMLICRRYINNNSDSESIVNTTFFKIFENLKNFKNANTNSFEAWSKQIAINEALRFLEKNKQYIFTDEMPYESIDESTTDRELLYEDYLTLLAKLPTGYRAVFSLYAIDGYNHKEIAGMLNITESTSRSQLTRAREILRNLISIETI